MPDSDPIRQAYDLASTAYADKFLKELESKPLDRGLLREFAITVGTGKKILDLGCGPGHTTAYLTALGLDATGIDVSPRMIELAQQNFPQSKFEVGDFLKLGSERSQVGGILAFYCIVHLPTSELATAFSEMYRALSDGGLLLLGFHGGSEVIHAENFLGTTAALDFHFFDPHEVESALRATGFVSIETRIRDPYPTEHPSQRCYLSAFKPISYGPLAVTESRPTSPCSRHGS